MKDLSLYNNSFNVQKSSTYHLSVQLGLDGYAFSIADAIRKRFNALKFVNFKEKFESTNEVYLEQVRRIFESDAFLSKNYKAVNFVYAFPSVILIPENSFNRQDLKDTFLLHYRLDDADELQFNQISEWNLYTLFSVPSDLTNYLVNKYPQVEFHHQISVWLRALAIKTKELASFVALYFNEHSYYMAVVENTKLMYFNSLKIINETDVLYTVANVLKSMEMDNIKTNFILGGDIDKNGDRLKNFESYFPNNAFLRLDQNSSYIFSFDEVDEHLFHTLLTID